MTFDLGKERHSFYDEKLSFNGKTYIVEATWEGNYLYGDGEWMDDFTVYDLSGVDITDELSDSDLMDIMEVAEKELAYQI